MLKSIYVVILSKLYFSNAEARQVNSPSPDDAVFRSLALAYSHAHKKMHQGSPCPEFSGETFRNGITNGAQVSSVTRSV